MLRLSGSKSIYFLASGTNFSVPLHTCMTNERRSRIESVLSKRQNDITVVLENVFDPHNISAIMRSCDAVGIGEIFVLNTKLPRHEKWGFKSSRSAIKWITAHQFTDLPACMDAVKARYSQMLGAQVAAGSLSLYQRELTQSVALVFGNEQNGISEELAACCDGNFTIPQVGMLASLNISVACAVTLYEAFRQKWQHGHYEQRKLSQSEWDEKVGQWSSDNENGA